ncbi:SDR family NAD(P)-dependent oxidoreductase [Croceicoccus ponticola]|nr:SDR family NAD(P)-dependent oxidoreductase [Croceicoccus ponticola]
MMKNIVVTGGMGALGRAIVSELGKSARVIAVDLGCSGEVEGAARVFGGVELTDRSVVEGVIAEIAEAFGELDGVVNSAGGFYWQTLANGDTEMWERMFQMNLLSALTTLKAAYPFLRKPGASIVNVGAAASIEAKAGMGAYVASKTGVRALTEALSDEWMGEGIRVNAILPTILDTPSNRSAMPNAKPDQWVATTDAAKVISFLVSDAAAAVTGAAIKLAMPQGIPSADADKS